jgi:hypothetical protein
MIAGTNPSALNFILSQTFINCGNARAYSTRLAPRIKGESSLVYFAALRFTKCGRPHPKSPLTYDGPTRLIKCIGPKNPMLLVGDIEEALNRVLDELLKQLTKNPN